jgi:CheY-like chemotaxis protein
VPLSSSVSAGQGGAGLAERRAAQRRRPRIRVYCPWAVRHEQRHAVPHIVRTRSGDGVQDVSQLIQSISGLLWPIIVAALLWRLLPSIRRIVESRSFTVKVAGVELSFQELAEKLVKSTAELQAKGPTPDYAAERSSPVGPTAPQDRIIKKILWVDDNPRNNAYESAQLESLGVSVRQVTSTQEALAALDRPSSHYDAVITDMGRQEASGFNPDAGIDLIAAMRAANIDIPVVVYASARARHRESEVAQAGGEGVTSGPGELFDALGRIGRFAQE